MIRVSVFLVPRRRTLLPVATLWTHDWPLWIPFVWLGGAFVWFVGEQYGARRTRERTINVGRRVHRVPQGKRPTEARGVDVELAIPHSVENAAVNECPPICRFGYLSAV